MRTMTADCVMPTRNNHRGRGGPATIAVPPTRAPRPAASASSGPNPVSLFKPQTAPISPSNDARQPAYRLQSYGDDDGFLAVASRLFSEQFCRHLAAGEHHDLLEHGRPERTNELSSINSLARPAEQRANDNTALSMLRPVSSLTQRTQRKKRRCSIKYLTVSCATVYLIFISLLTLSLRS